MECQSKLWAAGLSSELLYREDLSAQQKLLISIISGFMQTTGQFFASNSELGRALGLMPRQVSELISDLRDKKIIKIEIKDSNKRFISFPAKELTLAENCYPPSEKSLPPLAENCYISNNINNNLKTTSIISKNLDENTQDISTGRYALKKYPHIFLHDSELKKIQEIYKEKQLTKEEIQTCFMSCNIELESKKRQFNVRTLAFKYLTGYILEQQLKNKKLGQSSVFEKKIEPKRNMDFNSNKLLTKIMKEIK